MLLGMAFSAQPLLILAFALSISLQARADVILIKGNASISFKSIDASFTPRAPPTGMCGTILSANPVHACSALDVQNPAVADAACSLFVLVSRGNCSFETKVRNSQNAGFSAVIVADDAERSVLVTMAGKKTGILVPAVFVSKIAGRVLSQYANDSNLSCWILPAYGMSEWTIMFICMSILVVTAAVVAYLVARNRRYRQTRGYRGKKSYGMSYQEVKAMPTMVYRCRPDTHEAADTCVICLEDYTDGSTLRVLPCNHRFHSSCIDAWLTMWQTFCPVCKQDAQLSSKAGETTPLLDHNLCNARVATSVEEGEQEVTRQGPRTPSRSHQSCRFSFQFLPRRSTPTPICARSAYHHMSLQSLEVTRPNDLDAFRASPYFTPPSSFSSNSAPNLLGSVLDSQHHCGSQNNSLTVASPQTSTPSSPNGHVNVDGV